MRYLVKARDKRGQEKRLLKSIENGSLGKGSIAGDEYLHDMAQRASRRTWYHALGRDLFLRSTAGRGTALLGKLLRTIEREGRALAPELPARKWNRTVELLRL